MNEARRLYLSTHFRIDVADDLLKNASIFHQIWKHCHSAKNHRVVVAIVLAYGMHLEYTEGKIRIE